MEESIYCSCGSCGESGCCSPFMCLSKLVSENKSCMFGKWYIKELKVSWDFSEWVLDYVSKNGSLSEKDANRKYRDLLDQLR
jgi:hypothetical protein